MSCLICTRGELDDSGARRHPVRFGNIEGREGEPCRMINFRSRSCYILDLAPHRDDIRSMRFLRLLLRRNVVTQPIDGEKKRKKINARNAEEKEEAGYG